MGHFKMDTRALFVVVCLYASGCLSCDMKVPSYDQYLVETEAGKMVYAMDKTNCSCVKSMLEAGFDANTRQPVRHWNVWKLDDDSNNPGNSNTMLCKLAWDIRFYCHACMYENDHAVPHRAVEAWCTSQRDMSGQYNSINVFQH